MSLTDWVRVSAAPEWVQESEEELNARLRELKGMDKERQKTRKLTKAEQEEENLFKKNKGAARSLACSSSTYTCASGASTL